MAQHRTASHGIAWHHTPPCSDAPVCKRTKQPAAMGGELDLLLIFVGMACLFPVALYFLFLASLHHRTRPTMVSGVWDSVALLVGLSGFLLVGGTVLIFSLDRAIREFWLFGGTLREWAMLHAQAEFAARVTWASYLAVLIGATWWALRSRRNTAVVYQITPAELECLLPAIFERLGFELQRRGARWFWSASGEASLVGTPSSVPTKDEARSEWISVDGTESMRVAVISWSHADSPLRQDVEAELDRSLAHIRTPPSPVGVWFLTGTTVIFMATALLLGMIFFGSGR